MLIVYSNWFCVFSVFQLVEPSKILALGSGFKLVDLVANLRLSFLIPTFYRWKNNNPERINDLSRMILSVRQWQN